MMKENWYHATIFIVVIYFTHIVDAFANTQWGSVNKKYIDLNGSGVLEVLSAPYKKFTKQRLLRIPHLWNRVVSTQLECIDKCSETSGCVSVVYRAASSRCYAYNVTCSQVDYHCYKKKNGYVMFEIKVNFALNSFYLSNKKMFTKYKIVKILILCKKQGAQNSD